MIAKLLLMIAKIATILEKSFFSSRIFCFFRKLRKEPTSFRSFYESLGEPRKLQDSLGKPRRTQEALGKPRKAGLGEPRRLQESLGKPRKAQNFLEPPRTTQNRLEPPRTSQPTPLSLSSFFSIHFQAWRFVFRKLCFCALKAMLLECERAPFELRLLSSLTLQRYNKVFRA